MELLRGLEEEGELLVSPLSCTTSPSPFSPSSSSSPSSHASATASSPLLLPAPLEHVPLSPPAGPPAPPELPESPPEVEAALADSLSPPSDPPSPSSSLQPAPPLQPTNTGSTIPTAPPMSIRFPSACFKVICRYCLCNSHNICYKQCPDCYKSGGGMNYTDW